MRSTRPDRRHGRTVYPSRRPSIATALGILAAVLTFAMLRTLGAEEVGTHNALGGYRDACGALPGLVGDDC
jgi:hypothetical protein